MLIVNADPIVIERPLVDAVKCVGVVESVAVNVTGKVPAVVGVPLIWPLLGLIDSPFGRPLAE